MEDIINPFEIGRFFIDFLNDEYKNFIINDLTGTDEILNHEIARLLLEHMKNIISGYVDIEETDGYFYNGMNSQ